MADGQFANNRCACNGLKLVVRRCESQSTLAAVTSKVTKVVQHLRRSPIAQQRFRECQDCFDVPKHKLVQQVYTRWNLMYLMTERFCGQRLVIGDYSNRYDIENLSKIDWEILDEARLLLCPFMAATLKFIISEVIPTIKWLKNKIYTASTVHLTTMKLEPFDWLCKMDLQYFGAIEHNAMYSVYVLTVNRRTINIFMIL